MSRRLVLVGGAVLLALGLPIPLAGLTQDLPAAAATTTAKAVCGNDALLGGGPATPPVGAVTLAAGTDSAHTASYELASDTVYWLAPGVHTLGSGEFAQFDPDAGDSFVGAPGAVISGQGKNQSAFAETASGVVVEYLTIEDFTAAEGQMVVNHTGAADWTVRDDTIEDNGGAGVGLGTGSVVEDDCLTHNQEYGFSSFGGAKNITLSTNEISFNDSTDAYDHGKTPNTTCGCSGGGKFWDTENATVTNNYVHTNGNVGIWVDTDNAGFFISGNYISGNYAEGIIYEISYNAVISDNVLVDNAVGAGPGVKGFPDGAIYVSESGGDSRVASNDSGEFEVTGNILTNNWGGVVVWENSNRRCGDGYDQYCTLVTPATYTIASCTAHLSGSKPTQTPDYYDNCRWKAQNVTVSGNTFNFTPTAVGSSCTKANFCGFNGVFSEWGTTTPWKGWVVPIHISDDQDNHFSHNTYRGPWWFDGFAQGDQLTWSQWTSGVATSNSSGSPFDAQDAESSYTPATPVSTATTPSPPTTTGTTTGTGTTGGGTKGTTTGKGTTGGGTKGTTTGKGTTGGGTKGTTTGKGTTGGGTSGGTPGGGTPGSGTTPATTPGTGSPGGYWEVASDGGIFSFGNASERGSMGGTHLNRPIVAMAATPTRNGYWEVASDGGIFSFGAAGFYGSMGGHPLNAPIVGMAATPTGKGYWEVASDGGIFSFGAASFYGSMGGTHLNRPIVAMAATPTGNGYWEVASDGGIFSFGAASFYGSMGGNVLNAPIVAMAVAPKGKGYWEVASDGGVFNFGAAAFEGSVGGQTLSAPIVAMAATPTGKGYWEVASNGGVFNFGAAAFEGSMAGHTLNQSVVGMAPD